MFGFKTFEPLRAAGAVALLLILTAAGWAADPVDPTYRNGRYDYVLSYPDLFDGEMRKDETKLSSGVTFSSKDGRYYLTVWGRPLEVKENVKALLADAKKGADRSAAEVLKGSVRSGKNFYELTYTNPDDPEGLFVQRGIVKGKNAAFFVLGYPKAEAKRFVPIIKEMSASFKFSK